LDLLFLLLGLPALAAVVAPFAFGVSPAQVFLQSPRAFDWTHWDPSMTIVLAAVPFLPPVLAWILRLRSVLWGPATRTERRVGYAAASAGAAAVAALAALGVAEWTTLEWKDRGCCLAAMLVLAAGAALLALLWSRGAGPDARLRVALFAPYVANGLLVLVGFLDDRQLGWYLTAVSAAAAVAELALLTVRKPAAPAL
jgi:hypothetical protein